MTSWVEVWGKEPGDEAPVLLHEFPAAQWDDAFRQRLLRELAGRGVTEVEIRAVTEGGEA